MIYCVYYGWYLFFLVDNGSGFYRDFEVSGFGVERLIISYGNGFYFEGENEDGDD